MAQLVVAAAGAAVGFMVGGPAGAKIGWVAGSMLGSAFAPTQKSEGPRLGDLQVSGSSYGQPIPWIAGHPRVAGQIVWASDKREIATTEEAGKGGGGAEYTSYTYEVDLLILLSDNEIPGVARVWSNGELVRGDITKEGLWTRVTYYTGAADQLPDPTYEAAVGTANAPAYRGRGSVFIKSLQLGGSGQIPNLTFEIGTYAPGINAQLMIQVRGNGTNGGTVFTDEKGHSFSITDGAPYDGAITVTDATAFGGSSLRKDSTDIIRSTPSNDFDFSGDFTIRFWAKCSDIGVGTDKFPILYSYNGAKTGDVVVWVQPFNPPILRFRAGADAGGNTTSSITQTIAAEGTLATDWNYYTAVRHNGIIQCAINGHFGGSSADASQFGAPTQTPSLSLGGVATAPGYIYVQELDVFVGACYLADFTVPTAIWPTQQDFVGPYASATSTAQLANVIGSLCNLSGLSNSQFDVTDISPSALVQSLANSSVSSARTILETLASTYQFDAVLSDKIYFKPRGSASVSTITFDELGVMQDSTNPPDPLPLTMANELEIPAQIALTYSNIDGDYQTDTQYSDRLLTGMESTSAMQVPLGFTASEAKAIADTLLLDGAVSSLSTTITLDTSRAALEPLDVIDIVDEDSATYRMRIVRRTDAGGVTTLQCVADNASVLVQAGVTEGGTTGQTEVFATSATVLELLDIPLLSDSHNSPGHYVAVKGENASWKNAALFESADNVTYTQNQVISGAAVMGTCNTTLGNWTGGNFADETNTLTVDVGYGELSSVTHEAMLSNQATNAALVGDEIIQYREAALVSAGVYTLKGLLRGKRGTEWAIGSHAASERFVRLSSAGVRYVTQITSDIGKLIYFKAVSAGLPLSSATAESLTLAGNSLRPLAPVNLRVSNEADGSLLKWDRRTRLAENWLSGVMPLGESAESYIVKIYSGATLKRTLTASTAQANYTRTMQNADAIAGDMTFTVQQISGTFGPGIAASSTGGTGYTPVPQINTITLGGAFESGKRIRVTLNQLYVNYTTTVGDATLDGVATSLAAAINAASTIYNPYTATAVGSVVSVVHDNGWSFSFGAKLVTSDSLKMLYVQSAKPAAPGTADEMWCVLAPPGGSGELAGQPAGTVFEFTARSSIYDAVPIIRTYSYTLTSYTSDAKAMMLEVYQGLVSAFQASGDAAVYGINMLVNFYGTVSGIEFTGQLGIPGWFCYIKSPNSDLSYTLSLISPGATPVVPEDLPQVVGALVHGTIEIGSDYNITLDGSTYHYTTVADDTPLIVTTNLSSLIAANTDFIAGTPQDNSVYAGGYYFSITRSVPLVSFTYSSSVDNSTITLAVAAVKPAP